MNKTIDRYVRISMVRCLTFGVLSVASIPRNLNLLLLPLSRYRPVPVVSSAVWSFLALELLNTYSIAELATPVGLA